MYVLLLIMEYISKHVIIGLAVELHDYYSESCTTTCDFCQEQILFIISDTSIIVRHKLRKIF